MKFLHWLAHETKAVLAATAFFGACFLVIMLLKRLLLEEYNIAVGDYASALLLALVTAKVVVIFGKVSFGRQIGLAEVAMRTAVYAFAAFILLLIEHGLSNRHEEGGFLAALRGAYAHAEAPRIWATLICVSLAFAAYAALAILRRELGANRVAAAFLAPPRHDTTDASGH